MRVFKKIDNPLPVATGDIVYTYDEDDVAMRESEVLAVVDGIGYVLWETTRIGPLLRPIDAESYAKTAKEAAVIWQEQIENDIRYYWARADRSRELLKLLC